MATPNGLARIETNGATKPDNGVCHDDSSAPVRAQTIDELHSLQRKRSAPTTPIKDGAASTFAAALSEEERHRQQLQSISASLASLTRETGPKVVKGDPARRGEAPATGAPPTPQAHHQHHHPAAPTIAVSDSSLKFTHVLYNLSPAELYEQAIKYEKGSFITSTGALATLSGAKTGRSPRDKRVVKDEVAARDLWWGKGSPNIEMDEHTFLTNRERAVDYLNSLDKVFVNDQFLNWDPENRIKVRIISARAYHSLFMHNMCIRPTDEELESFGTPDFTIYNAGQFPCNRYTHYMTSSTSVDINLARREMVILGTQYAGEMKKGLFGVMHYLMPKRGILSLHSGCNMGKDGDVALFFGLSGTGKTTLSTDHNRLLIGDDEHCWSENGVSNIEGGCYAKCIDLSQEKEPDIWNAIKFGAVLENVVFDEHTREVDYTDKSVTEPFLHRREHSGCLPDRVHPQRQDTMRRSTPQERDPAGVRRLRRAPAGEQAGPGADHVPLHQRIHRPGRRHGGRHQGATGHLLRLLRRGLHHAPPDQVRRHARREDAEVRRHRVARQHRLVWRQVRCGQEDPASLHQEDHRRHPLRRASHRQLPEDRGLWPGDPD
ncbi:phosphoenolpyruvate carboxykinase homolog2 [Zea mays]|uniref:phosphoenolpyruvate carboxykinase (ATP) n=1 Tax=Zea mays TaxID=4577 RepID=A0A1D6PEH7_MAIZE|nr:phosphoenolpyruvate carboxykinase homolog2 [Zea mays]